MNAIEIVRRQEACDTARSSLKVIWNDVERYIMPLRIGDMYIQPSGENAVRLIRDDIYDSTAIFSAVKMSNAMHGSITNPWTMWRKREFWLPKLNKDRDAMAWLQECDAIEWTELYRSNFDAEISACYQDLVGPGNCFLSVEAEEDNPESWAGFNFTAIPIKESFFERDHRGDMYRFYRLLNWKATEIKSKWPKEKLPDVVEKALGEGGNPDEGFDIIYAIYVRPGKEANTGMTQPYAPKERPVGCKYVFKATKEEIGEEGGYYDFPVLHCPYARTSGSIWGHGIGMLMAPTAKYINYRLELQDTAERKQVDPPKLVRGGALLSDLDSQPGGVTMVRSLDDVKELISAGHINDSKASIEDLRNMLREAFHNDELQLKDSPTMSATEAQIRYELMNRVLGPTMGLIQNNLLSKGLDRTFKSLLRNKQFPEPPDIVKRNKAQLKVVYTGALMRAQKSDQVAAIERWLGQVGAALKVFPEVKYVVDIMKWARNLAVELGIPQDMLNTEADATAAWEQAQRVMAEQMKQQILQQRADVAKTQAEVPQNGAQG